MKRLSILSLVLSMVASVAMAQIKIGDNPQTLDPSSLLELESNSRVLVISKVTTAQMEAIAPQRGGMVYNTDTECVHYFNGAQWVNLCDAVSFTITNDPIENLRSTIAITQTQGNYNLEVATNSIRTEQIADGGINGVDIQDNSIGRNKLGDAAVGPDELATESVDSDAIIDGTILPRDIGSSVPNHVLATDINGTVLWQDQNDLYELSFDKDTNTLAIVPATGGGNNSINLEALVGSDDQTLTLTPDNRLQIENGNEIDLSAFNNAGTDNQTLSLTGNVLAITGGNTVSLVDYVNTDNQQLSITGNRIELTDGGFVDLPPGTVDTDEQDLSLAGTTINITDGNGVDLEPLIETVVGDNGYLTAEIDGSTTNEQITDITLTAANVLQITEGGVVISEDLSALAGGGGSTELADQITITGDGTLGNEFTVGTIGSAQITNGTILLEDINQNGAADGQIIKWDATANAGTGGWITADDRTDGTGVPALTNGTILIGDATDLPQERVLNGDISMDNTGLATIAVDAVTSAEIADLSIATEDLADNSVTIEKIAEGLDGQILTTDGTDVIWADNNLTVSNLATDDLTQDNEDRIYNFGANALTFIGTGTIGISQNPAFNAAAALHVDGTTLSNGFATASPLGFYLNGDLDTGLHFDEFTPDLVSLTAGNIRALTVTNTAGTTNVLVPERLQLGGLVADNTNAIGTNGQVLTSTGTGVAWQDVPGSLTGITGSIFFADATGAPTENNVQLFWDTANNYLGVGTNTPDRKLDVEGEIRGNQFSSTGGTVAEPAYSFSTGDDANTGMFRPAADEIGFSVGGEEALRIEEDGGNTNITIFQSLTLDNLLLDKDGDAGTPGQILSSTGTQTDWIDAPTGGTVNTDATLTGDGQTGTPLSIADNSINSARIADGTIANEDIAANAIETANILDANVTEAKIAPGADGEVLTTAGGVATWAAPTAGAVISDATLDGDGQTGTPLSIANNSITSTRIVDGTIINADIAANAIETANILDANVTEGKIAPGADGEVLTTAGGVATWAAPTAGVVISDATLDGNGQTGTPLSIADNSITSARIVDGTIANADIAANAIETANILDANVTEAKIAPGADGEVLTTAGGVATWTAPTAGAVSTDGTTITGDGNAADLSVPIGGITTGQILDGTIANADIAANAIETANILDANVTEAKIAPGADGEVLTTAGGVVTWAAPTAGAVISDATLDGNGQTGTPLSIANNSINSARIIDASINADDLADDSVETAKILNGTIINEDIALGAAIDGSKINPDFGTQNITTSGNLEITGTGTVTVQTILVHPDYVFQKYFTGTSSLNDGYTFKNLSEIEQFVKQNNHLPGVQSAKEIKTQGFWNLGEASRINLEKIEELFLHTIEQEKKIEVLQEENLELSKELEALKTQVEAIKKMLSKKE